MTTVEQAKEPTTNARLTMLQAQFGGRTLGTDCTEPGCERTELGIVKPMSGSRERIKLVRHQRPQASGGGWCLAGGRTVELAELRPLPERGARRRHAARERGAGS